MPATTGMRQMSRQDANAAFARSSFLYGGNAAYIEDLYSRYETDPNSVDAQWGDFFGSLKDQSADVTKSARGASGRSRPSSSAMSFSPRSTGSGPRPSGR